jgi:hypothetical protein
MAKIPTPDRGQPLDVSYIYQIVEAINELSEQSSSATYRYSSVDTSAGPQNALITDTKIVAGETTVYNTETDVSAGKTESFSYSFKSEYKYPPIVTATPVLFSSTGSGRDVSVVIESVTTSRVDGKITFNSSGRAALKVNIIAVGIPN